jgi:hypothetical protein
VTPGGRITRPAKRGPAEPPCARTYPEVYDRAGCRLHVGARVRVDRSHALLPGRQESFCGEVTAIKAGVRHGEPAVLVSVAVRGAAYARTVLPSHCTVLMRRMP